MKQRAKSMDRRLLAALLTLAVRLLLCALAIWLRLPIKTAPPELAGTSILAGERGCQVYLGREDGSFVAHEVLPQGQSVWPRPANSTE